MACYDGDPDHFLDGLGRVGRPALGVLHRVKAGSGTLLNPLRQVDRGAAGTLQHPGDLDALVETPAAVAPFLEGVADQHREGLAALLLDRIHDRQREPHPVLETSAEPVGAHVEQRAHELGQQVAVGRMQLDRVKAGLLDPPGGLAEKIDEFENLGDRCGPDLFALLLGVLVDDLVAGRPRQLEHPVGRAEGVIARDRALATGMLELHRALRAVAVHGFGEASQTRYVVVAVGDQAGDRWPAGLHVGRRRADDDETRPAPGDVTVVGDVSLAHLTVRMGRADVRRNMDNAIGELEVAELDRAEQMRERHVLPASRPNGRLPRGPRT